MEKIVITGIGLKTPIGLNFDVFKKNIFNGTSGIIKAYDHLPVNMFAPVKCIQNIKDRDRTFSMLILALNDAINDSGKSFIFDDNTGIYVSSSKGGTNMLDNYFSEEFIDNIKPDGPGVYAYKKLLLKGKLFNIVAACASGIYSVFSSLLAIKQRLIKRAVICSVESALNPLILSGFKNMGVLTENGPSPFREKRDGFAPGEGAACLMVETFNEAEKRGAKIYGEICSIGLFTDTTSIVSLDRSGMAIKKAIEKALFAAKLKNSEIDAVCVHGTATENNDIAESNGIISALTNNIPCFGIKHICGHTLGSSALIDLCASLAALEKQKVPSTKADGEIDKKCAVNISDKNREFKLNKILSLNFGFGGHIGAVIIGKL